MKTVCTIMCTVFLLFAGCSVYHPSVYSLQDYPLHREFSVLAFAWKTHQTHDAIHVEGIIHNNNYERLRDLVLTVSVLDSKGGKSGEGTYLAFPVRIDIGATVPFDLNIPYDPAHHPVSVQFITRYRFEDRELPDVLDSQSFEEKIP